MDAMMQAGVILIGYAVLIVVIIGAVLILIRKTQDKKETEENEETWQEKVLRERQAQYDENQRQRRQSQVDNKIDHHVEHFYQQYGEEWIKNASKSRLAMAIDEMLGDPLINSSRAQRVQRTLAAAVLETVLEREGKTIRQQQAVSREGSQTGIVVDPMLAVDIVDTASALAADADYTNDLDVAEEIDDFDADDLGDMDVDLDID